MKSNGVTFRQRDLTKKMTVTVGIEHPLHHRVLFRFGFRIVAFGFWLMGLGGTELEEMP